MEQKLRELMYLVATQEGISLPRAAKKMAIGYSQLYRVMSVLGSAKGIGGLDLVELREGDPPRLYLTDNGRAAVGEVADA